MLLAGIMALASVGYGGANGRPVQQKRSPLYGEEAFPQYLTTMRASVASGGAQADNLSQWPDISADGRYVTFASLANNLWADSYPYSAVYVHDTVTRETMLVSLSPEEPTLMYYASLPAISGDGRRVAFVGDWEGVKDGVPYSIIEVFVHDLTDGVTTMVSVAPDGTPGDWASSWPAISGDGRFVAFVSSATNLLESPPPLACGFPPCAQLIYVHDSNSGLNRLVSVSSDGALANAAADFPDISGDGRYVSFSSTASNLVSGDSNGITDILVHDLETGITIRVSVGMDGGEPNGPSRDAGISADGRYVAFSSLASNLVIGDTNGHSDIFVYDMQTGLTERVSVVANGTAANNWSGRPRISADGRYVAFTSSANNLVAGDTNGFSDIFVHDRQNEWTTRASVAFDGRQATNSSDDLAISSDGASVAFFFYAADPVNGDSNMCPGPPYEHELGECPNIFVSKYFKLALTESVFLPLLTR